MVGFDEWLDFLREGYFDGRLDEVQEVLNQRYKTRNAKAKARLRVGQRVICTAHQMQGCVGTITRLSRSATRVEVQFDGDYVSRSMTGALRTWRYTAANLLPYDGD